MSTVSEEREGSAGTIRPWRRRGLIRVTVAVCLGYLALAIAFSLLTPAWENSDEIDHVRYIEHLAAHGAPPRIAAANGIESHQAPLYYYLGAAWQLALGIGSFAPDTPPVASEPDPYVLTHDYTQAQREQAGWVHQLRLASIACGLATVLAALATGWLLTRRLAFTAALGATVALWPKFLVVTSAVTNTALAVALCACALPCFLLWHRSRSLGWAAATGLFLGGAGLAQVSALPVVGLMLILVIAYSAARRDWRAPLVAVGCFAAVCGWWYVRNTVLYGDPLASAETEAYLSKLIGFAPLVRSPPSLSPDVLESSLGILAHSTWYDGGWNQIQLPRALDAVVWVAAAISIAAVFWSRLRARLVLATCALGSVIAWLLITRVTTQAEGRYLLVGIVAWAAFLVAGGERLGGGRLVGLWVWPAIFLGLDGYVLVTWLIPDAHL